MTGSILSRVLLRVAARFDRNLAGVTGFPAGSYYSPLLDLAEVARDPQRLVTASERAWSTIDLRENDQDALLEEFLGSPTGLPLPPEANARWRYFARNEFFVFSDAWALTQMIAKWKPRRIIEVGSGFSSAAMLDAREHLGLPIELTFIEPYPERLESLLRAADHASARVLRQRVQEVAASVFAKLEAGDFLFIDSSHVAKVGSDLADLFVRVLPALRPGVFVHFHDIFFPGPYPLAWLRQGRAWNEPLFLQAFLQFNSAFRVEWFNAFAGVTFRERLAAALPRFLDDTGGSFWLRRIN